MIPPQKPRKRRSPRPPHPFDTLHGTHTGALIPGEDLATGHRHDHYITAYHGTAPSLFHKLFSRWQELATHPIERTAFYDIGAGKGRAMLLAAHYPFRRIAGVELHPALAAAARENIEHWQATYSTAPPFTIYEADVMQLRLPSTPTLLFLFNPFGLILMDRFLTRLTHLFRNRPGELDILYVNDEQKELFEQEHPRFNLLWNGRIYLSREDAASDRATIAHDADGLYATSGYEDCSIYRLRR